MGFQKGNPGGALSMGVPRAGAKESRKAARSLAMAIRDGVKPEAVRDWLVGIWQTGKDPISGELVDMRHRMHALQMLTDRGWGQAAQMVVLEGTIKHEAALDAPPDERPRMTLAQIEERRRALRQLLSPALPAGVIDVVPNE
jgi:hypothetical protein